MSVGARPSSETSRARSAGAPHRRSRGLSRTAFRRSVAAELARQPCVVLAIGLDRFARVRGAIGYALAEELIANAAERAQAALAASVMRRLAPDTIGLLIPSQRTGRYFETRLGRLVRDLELPSDIQGFRISTAVRIGFAAGRCGRVSPDDLIHQAEIGLDQAREMRRRVHAFSPEEYGDPSHRLSLLGDLSLGLERGEMRLVYQPQARCDTGEVVSVEALLRWDHPDRGEIPPAHFIPMAEETGQIRELSEWAIRRALLDSVRLEAAGFPLRVAINISGRLLCDQIFVERALRLVRERAHAITFEITESAAIDAWTEALTHLRRFAEAGVRLSIDDYGSGLSSLAYVQQLPAHELKIDRMFVTDIAHSHRDPLLVRSTVELGHALELEVVAEGIQDYETFALVKMMGCDAVQGYLLSEALEFADLMTFLIKREAPARLAPPHGEDAPWPFGLSA